MKIIKMRYSIKPRDGLWIGYGLFSFAKNMDKILSNNYGQKLLDSAKKSTSKINIKAASKRAIQKTAEATADLIGNKIADKITSVPKKKSKKRIAK